MVDIRKESEPRRENTQVIEMERTVEVQPQVESWMEKIEKRFGRVPNQTQTPMDDQVVVQNPQSQQPPVVLPATQQMMQVGKQGKIEEGVTWLVAWVIRQIKMLTKSGRKVRLQDIPEIKNES